MAPNGTQTNVPLASGSGYYITHLYVVAVDASDNLYYTMGDETSIIVGYAVEVNKDGTYTKLLDHLYGPHGLAVDAAGNVFVSQVGGGVTKYTRATGTLIKVYSSGDAYGIAFDRNGNLFINDYGLTTRIAPATAVNFGNSNVCPAGQGTPTPCTQSEQLTFTIIGAGTFGPPVALTQGTPGLDFSVASTTCTGPQIARTNCTVNVTFSPTSPGARNGAVELVDASGNVLATTGVFGTGSGPQIAFSPGTQTVSPTTGSVATGVTVDAAGNVFYTDAQSQRVVKIAAGTGTQTSIAPAGLSFPSGVAVDGAGNLFITDLIGGTVVETPAGSSVGTTVVSGLSHPGSVAVDGAGDLFIADTGNNRVVEQPAGGGAQVSVGTGLNGSGGVAVDAAGNLFIADSGNSRLLEIPAGGVAQSTVGSGFNAPAAVAVDAAGNVFVADGTKFYEVPAGGGPQFTVAGGFTNVSSLSVDSSGNLFLTDVGAQKLFELNRSQAPSFSFAATAIGATSADRPKSTQLENIGNSRSPPAFPTS